VAQEYYAGSVVTTPVGIYRLKSGGVGSSDPDTDGGVNWELIPTQAQLDAKADQATTYTETEVDDLIATRTESPGETTVTGTATFTNSTNNIALTGIGSIGLEIGDVVQVTGTASNNKLFTVEVITDSGNVIVNQAHAGVTTSKSLVNETVSATVTLVAKWYSASFGLGQGVRNVSRSIGVTYTNNTGRPLDVRLSVSPSASFTLALVVDGQDFAAIRIGNFSASDSSWVGGIIPAGATYSYEIGGSSSVQASQELR
jgi:hypothetical protein